MGGHKMGTDLGTVRSDLDEELDEIILKQRHDPPSVSSTHDVLRIIAKP
jgi:hypothetical protein